MLYRTSTLSGGVRRTLCKNPRQHTGSVEKSGRVPATTRASYREFSRDSVSARLKSSELPLVRAQSREFPEIPRSVREFPALTPARMIILRPSLSPTKSGQKLKKQKLGVAVDASWCQFPRDPNCLAFFFPVRSCEAKIVHVAFLSGASSREFMRVPAGALSNLALLFPRVSARVLTSYR